MSSKSAAKFELSKGLADRIESLAAKLGVSEGVALTRSVQLMEKVENQSLQVVAPPQRTEPADTP